MAMMLVVCRFGIIRSVIVRGMCDDQMPEPSMGFRVGSLERKGGEGEDPEHLFSLRGRRDGRGGRIWRKSYVVAPAPIGQLNQPC